MLVINPDECIDWGMCEPKCPVRAFVPDSADGARKWLDIAAGFAPQWPNRPGLRNAVVESGGDWRRIQTDLERYRTDIDPELARNGRQAFSLGLEGTPAYLIGPILVKGGLDENGFAHAIGQARPAEHRRHAPASPPD